MEDQLNSEDRPRANHLKRSLVEAEGSISPETDDALFEDNFVSSATPVLTIDSSDLQRPQMLLGWRLLVLGFLVIIACIIGFNLGSAAINNFVYASAREQAAVEQQLQRDVALNLPAPSTFIGFSDEEIRDNFTSAGYQFYEDEVSDGTTLEVIKLPSDVSIENGKALIDKGLTEISAEDAAKVLNGLWRFDVSRGDSTVMRLRFSDFTSGSAEAAITKVMATQGIPEDSVTENGMDDSGNTYKSGSVVINGITVSWRVSVIALSEIYSINAIPSTAMYVGVRYTY